MNIFAGWLEKNNISTRFPREGEAAWQPHLKIAAFELDNCIIELPKDFKQTEKMEFSYMYPQELIRKFISLQKDNYAIIIISNQPNVIKGWLGINELRNRFDAVVKYLGERNIPIAGIFSTNTGYDSKPHSGMWEILKRMYRGVNIREPIDMKESFYCGPGGGRLACAANSQWGKLKADKDYIDRAFATNIGIAYRSPEEFFTDRIIESSRPWKWPLRVLTMEQRLLYKQVSLNSIRGNILCTYDASVYKYVQHLWPESKQFVIAIESPQNSASERIRTNMVNEFPNSISVELDKECKDLKYNIMISKNVIIHDCMKYRQIWIDIVRELRVPVLFLVLDRSDIISQHLDNVWIEYKKIKHSYPSNLYCKYKKEYRDPETVQLKRSGLLCALLNYPLTIPVGDQGDVYLRLIV